ELRRRNEAADADALLLVFEDGMEMIRDRPPQDPAEASARIPVDRLLDLEDRASLAGEAKSEILSRERETGDRIRDVAHLRRRGLQKLSADGYVVEQIAHLDHRPLGRARKAELDAPAAFDADAGCLCLATLARHE